MVFCVNHLTFSSTGPFVPYNVSVMSRNPAGCGNTATISCFTQEGGGELVAVAAFSFNHPYIIIYAVPTFSPIDVRMLREDSSTISVIWQPFTLVEARGYIEYIVRLYIVTVSSMKRQDPGSIMQRVPMNQSNAVFTGVDTTSDYEATVGTISLSNNATGPGKHVTIPPSLQTVL